MSGYDSTFRPNYEGMSALLWFLTAGASLMIASHIPMPSEPFWAVALMSVVLAVRRLPKAKKLYRIKSSMKGASLSFVKLKSLKRILKSYKGSLWLGYGFEWDTDQTQLAYEVTKRNAHEVVGKRKRAPESTGAPWIHGAGVNKEKRVSQPLKHTEGHWLLVGTTGSGKTRCFDTMITQAIMRDEPVVIIDPKGDQELCNNARRACAAAGNPDKFVYFHPGFAESSVRIDPLHNFNRPTELASRIAVLIPSETGADPFTAFGQMALNNVVQGILFAGNRPNLANIRMYLEGGVDSLMVAAISAYCDRVLPSWEFYAGKYLAKADNDEKKAQALMKFYKDYIQPEHSSPDLEGLFSMFVHDREHFSKMTASLLPVLNMLTSGDLTGLLSPNADDPNDDRLITDMARCINNRQVLYVGLDSLTDSMVGSAIGSILLSDMTAVAGDRYNYGKGGPKSVNVFVDEAAEVINTPFIQALNKGRGAGFRLYVATQTFADFSAKLGNEAKARQVLGNVNNILTLRVTDAETQKYICDSLPETKVNYMLTNHSTNSSSSSMEAHSGSLSERLEEETVPIVPAQVLGLLPNLEFFARMVDGRLVKGRLPILLGEDEQ